MKCGHPFSSVIEAVMHEQLESHVASYKSTPWRERPGVNSSKSLAIFEFLEIVSNPENSHAGKKSSEVRDLSR